MTDEQRTLFHISIFTLLLIAFIASLYHIITKGVLHAYDIAIPTGSIGNLGQEMEFLALI